MTHHVPDEVYEALVDEIRHFEELFLRFGYELDGDECSVAYGWSFYDDEGWECNLLLRAREHRTRGDRFSPPDYELELLGYTVEDFTYRGEPTDFDASQLEQRLPKNYGKGPMALCAAYAY